MQASAPAIPSSTWKDREDQKRRVLPEAGNAIARHRIVLKTMPVTSAVLRLRDAEKRPMT